METGRWPSTHESVLANAGRGEADAWQKLHSGYHEAVINYAVSRGLSRNDADDVAQEVFQHLFLQLSQQRFRYDQNKGRFRGWLALIIRQRAWRFRRSRDKDTAERFDTVTMAEMVEGRPYDSDTDKRIEFALGTLKSELSDEDWQVFDLYWYQQLKPQAIAAKTSRSSPQVSKLIFKCRRRLLSLFQESGST